MTPRLPSDATVLVVDDEDFLREAIVFDLKRRGFKVLEAKDGNDAFTHVQSTKVDAVVSDIRMPMCDGLELLKKVRDYNLEIPVMVLITGFADVTAEEAYDLGACSLLAKPFDRKVMFETVLRMIQPREERWAPPASGALEDVLVKVQLPGLPEARQAKLINLGQGGVFVSLPASEIPNIDERVGLHIQFKSEGTETISGTGIVRWTRKTEVDGLRVGCGIEFLELTDGARAQVLKFIAEIQSRAFIPKN